MSKPQSKKESFGQMLRIDAKYYCQNASRNNAQAGKRIMKRAKRKLEKEFIEDSLSEYS